MKRTLHLLEDTYFFIIQFFSLIFTYFFVSFLYKPKIIKPKDLNVPFGTLIISNHQSMIDPWLVTTYLGLNNAVSLLPVRYPITPLIFRKPVVNFILWSLGGFDIGLTPLEKAKGLLFIKTLIERKYTVLLFPEGRRVKSTDEEAKFHKGMNVIISENIPFLLVKLSGVNNFSLLKFRKNEMSITYSHLVKDIPKDEKLKLVDDFYNLNAGY